MRVGPKVRRSLLGQISTLCRQVSDALPASSDSTVHVWAYVVALANHGAACEAETDLEDEGLASLRF